MPILHAKVSGKNDGAASLVRASDWNAEHLNPPWVVLWHNDMNDARLWAMPNAVTELYGQVVNRNMVDLRWAKQARLSVRVNTGFSTNAKIRAQYSVNEGGAWSYLNGASGPSVGVSSAGTYVSEWVNIASAAQVENSWLRFVGLDGADGNGRFGLVLLQVR